HRLQVLQHLARLGGEVAAADDVTLGVLRDLARDVEERAGAADLDALAVGRGIEDGLRAVSLLGHRILRVLGWRGTARADSRSGRPGAQVRPPRGGTWSPRAGSAVLTAGGLPPASPP